jgi:hypothetical protein
MSKLVFRGAIQVHVAAASKCVLGRSTKMAVFGAEFHCLSGKSYSTPAPLSGSLFFTRAAPGITPVPADHGVTHPSLDGHGGQGDGTALARTARGQRSAESRIDPQNISHALVVGVDLIRTTANDSVNVSIRETTVLKGPFHGHGQK